MTGSKFVIGGMLLVLAVTADPESALRLLQLSYCAGSSFLGAWVWVWLRPRSTGDRPGWLPQTGEFAAAFFAGVCFAPFVSEAIPGEADMSHWMLGGGASGMLSTPIARYVLSRPAEEMIEGIKRFFGQGGRPDA